MLFSIKSQAEHNLKVDLNIKSLLKGNRKNR